VIRTVCRTCHGEVRKLYNHVGDCDTPGACTGTFEHVKKSPCRRDVGHADVMVVK
jgi:hypothetical protein